MRTTATVEVRPCAGLPLSLSLSLPSVSACAFVWRALNLALRSATQCAPSACVSGNGKDRACDMEFMNTF